MAVDTAAATSSQAGSFHVRVAPVLVVAKQRGLRLGRSSSVFQPGYIPTIVGQVSK